MPPPSVNTLCLLVDEALYEYESTQAKSYRCRVRIYEASEDDAVVILATEEAKPDTPAMLVPSAAAVATDVRRVYGV